MSDGSFHQDVGITVPVQYFDSTQRIHSLNNGTILNENHKLTVYVQTRTGSSHRTGIDTGTLQSVPYHNTMQISC